MIDTITIPTAGSAKCQTHTQGSSIFPFDKEKKAIRKTAVSITTTERQSRAPMMSFWRVGIRAARRRTIGMEITAASEVTSNTVAN